MGGATGDNVNSPLSAGGCLPIKPAPLASAEVLAKPAVNVQKYYIVQHVIDVGDKT